MFFAPADRMSNHIIRRQLLGDYEGGCTPAFLAAVWSHMHVICILCLCSCTAMADGRYKFINLQGAAIGNGAIDFVQMVRAHSVCHTEPALPEAVTAVTSSSS